MTPQIVHRYAFPIREAIEHLLGDAVGDCQAWRIRVEGEEVVIDVVAPAPGIVPSVQAIASLASNETAKHNTPVAMPERKGGDLARQAGIMCNMKGFRTFLTLKYDAEVVTAEDAAGWIRQHCSIKSRADLDHDGVAGIAFRDINQAYKMWLDGY